MADVPVNDNNNDNHPYDARGNLLDPSPRTTQQLYREVASVEDKVVTRFNGRIAEVIARIEAMAQAQTAINDNYTRVPTLLDRAISDVKALFVTQLEALTELTKAKLDLVETQIDERDVRTTEKALAIKTAVDVALVSLNDKLFGVGLVNDERFASVARQFVERDVRTEQAAIATKIAVDAALQAQKEAAGAQNESNTAAITKSEAATVKQIDGISALLTSNVTALNDKIADLKGRLDRGEGTTSGQVHGETMMNTSVATLVTELSMLKARVDRGDGSTHGQATSNSGTMTIVSVLIAGAAVVISLVVAFAKQHVG